MRTGPLIILLTILSLVTLQRNTVWDDEVSLYLDTAAKAPSKARNVHNRGLVAIANKDYAGAIVLLRKALEMDPYRAESYISLGIAYAQLGQPDPAREMYQRSLSLSDINHIAHFNLGLLYYKEYGRYDLALQHFLRSRDQNPGNPDVYRNLGFTYRQLGREDLAQQAFAEERRMR